MGGIASRRGNPDHKSAYSGRRADRTISTTPYDAATRRRSTIMSKQPVDHIALKIKRRRAPVWPFATRRLCEKVVKLLEEDEFGKELSPRPGGVENPPLD